MWARECVRQRVRKKKVPCDKDGTWTAGENLRCLVFRAFFNFLTRASDRSNKVVSMLNSGSLKRSPKRKKKNTVHRTCDSKKIVVEVVSFRYVMASRLNRPRDRKMGKDPSRLSPAILQIFVDFYITLHWVLDSCITGTNVIDVAWRGRVDKTCSARWRRLATLSFGSTRDPIDDYAVQHGWPNAAIRMNCTDIFFLNYFSSRSETF